MIVMMLWMLLSIAVCTLTAAAQGQVSGCSDDSQCSSGYYCHPDVRYCSKCLRCEKLRRHPPQGNVDCVRSVAECGSCLKGYVDDLLGMGSGCTEPENEGSVTWYFWLLGGLLIAGLLLCAVGVVIYALRNTETFRVLASTRTSVEAPVVGKEARPTAPQPPPYNYSAPYEPVPPASPARPAHPAHPAHAPQGDYMYQPTANTDASQPLVKRAPAGGGAGGAGGAAREAAGSQHARVFTNPAYVRNVPGVPPPSYESAFGDESEHEFVPQDEDTMPSAWTPAADADHGAQAGAGVAAAGAGAGAAGGLALRRPSRSDAGSPPPNKMRCIEVAEGSKGERGDGGSSSGALPPSPPPPPPHPAGAPSVVINVLNINSVHKRSDVTL